MEENILLTDIHTHVLPDIDDGPGSLADSLTLLTALRRTGVRRIFCTSHYGSPHFNVDKQMLADAYGVLTAEMSDRRTRQLAQGEARCGDADSGATFGEAAAGVLQRDHNDVNEAGIIELPEIVLGAEVRMTASLVDDIRAKTVPTLGDTDYVLIEFPTVDLPSNLLQLVHELDVRGYRLIMAHPERNLAVQKQPSILDELLDMGLRFQLTAQCFVNDGRDAHAPGRLAWQILMEGKASLIASDTHNTDRRPPMLAEAYAKISQRLGDEVASQLAANANAVWENREIHAVGKSTDTARKTKHTHHSFFSLRG